MTLHNRADYLSAAFEHSTDGLLLLEDGLFIDCNPAAVNLLGCDGKHEIVGKHPSDFSPHYQPDGKESFTCAQQIIAQTIERGNMCFEWVHQRKDGQLLTVEILLTAFKYDGRHILHSNWRDITRRREAEEQLQKAAQLLEARVEERTRELDQRRRVAESLRDTLAVVNSNQPLPYVLDRIARQAQQLTRAAACVIYSIDKEKNIGLVEAASGILDQNPRQYEFSLDSTPGLELMGIVSGRDPQVTRFDKSRVSQLEDDPNVDPVIRQKRVEFYQQFAASLAVPVFIREKPYGAMILYYSTSQKLTDQQVQVSKTLAEQAALAIENANLHHSLQEQRIEAEHKRRVAEGLREGLAVLNSNRSTEDILDFIVGQAVELLNTGAGALYLLDDNWQMLSVGASRGLEATYTALELPVGGAITGRAVAINEPVSVPDLQQASDLLKAYLSEPNIPPGWPQALEQLTARYNAVLAVPVHTRDRTYGAITLYYTEAHHFTDDTIELAVAFARQAALVIENAGLRERVRKSAALEERNRLARDLHDAVTQTLFSASLLADAIPDLLETDQLDALRKLEMLGNLTRGALAEMRTLLIELRPARLVEADIEVLITQLVDAARGRSKLDIKLSISGNCETPADVKIALYRILQEALNNILKHAKAQHVYISLKCQDDRIAVQILDDGCGFSPDDIAAGHFGVQNMEERAAGIEATFLLETHPGEGTEVEVIWRNND